MIYKLIHLTLPIKLTLITKQKTLPKTTKRPQRTESRLLLDHRPQEVERRRRIRCAIRRDPLRRRAAQSDALVQWEGQVARGAQ